MTDHPPRLFSSDAEIVHLGEGLLACSLAREEWTHEAHLAACLYLLTERPDVDVDAEIAGIISRFNESVGGVNDDNGGYHDTITRAFVAGVRLFLAETAAQASPRESTRCSPRRWAAATGRCASIRARCCSRCRRDAASSRRTCARCLERLKPKSSSPRRRGSIPADLSARAAPPAAMDSRLRGNDEKGT